MARRKKPASLPQRRPEQLAEYVSSPPGERRNVKSESDAEERKEEPDAPQNKASKVTKIEPSVPVKQTLPPPSSVPHSQTRTKRVTFADTQATLPPPTQPLPDNDEASGSEDERSAFSPSRSGFTNSPKKPTSKVSKTALKRPAEPKSDEKIVKGKKRAKAGDENAKKEKPSGRVFSEVDEVRILNGLIDYQKQKGGYPSADMVDFHEFVKGNLQVEITSTQLYEKVRRLKNKYFKNVERAEKGKNVDFSRPHETLTFNLSEKIWGGGGMTGTGVGEKENDNGGRADGKMKKSSVAGNLTPSSRIPKKFQKKNVVLKEPKDDVHGDTGNCDSLNGVDFEKKYPFMIQASTGLGMESLTAAEQVSLLKANLSVVGGATSEKSEQKWKEPQVEEIENLLKKFLMFADHTRRVLDAIKK